MPRHPPNIWLHEQQHCAAAMAATCGSCSCSAQYVYRWIDVLHAYDILTSGVSSVRTPLCALPGARRGLPSVNRISSVNTTDCWGLLRSAPQLRYLRERSSFSVIRLSPQGLRRLRTTCIRARNHCPQYGILHRCIEATIVRGHP